MSTGSGARGECAGAGPAGVHRGPDRFVGLVVIVGVAWSRPEVITSGGHLDGDQFVLLQDDRGLQPPDNLVPAVRQEAVEKPARAASDRLCPRGLL